ncbi:MAG TPA: hypothetical protein PLZ58_01180 [Candidatus Saccharibacteria bacterium]|nr:hypothetical protein [Candidatus Saccharibacteria bacterium]HRQ07066.1 hypothetical protein [Candidatus Saccharibacteria bacterium]
MIAGEYAEKNSAINYNTIKDEAFPVPPVHFAFVHLNKPFDLAMVGQTMMATGNMKADVIGQSLKFNHPKVISKLESWNISNPLDTLEGRSRYYKDVEDMKKHNSKSRLIGAVVVGGENPFLYDWRSDDIVVIGGANGLSASDIEKMDDLISIPMTPEVDFLTVSTVVSALTYHILTKRELWQKMTE